MRVVIAGGESLFKCLLVYNLCADIHAVVMPMSYEVVAAALQILAACPNSNLQTGRSFATALG